MFHRLRLASCICLGLCAAAATQNMAKTDATRRRSRRSKIVTTEVVEDEDNVDTEGQIVLSGEQIVRTEEMAPAESTDMKKDQDEQDSQMPAVIEVKGSTSTVTVSWDKKNKEGEVVDAEKIANASDQMMVGEEQIISSTDAVGSSEDAPSERTETKQVMQESGDKQETQMDTVAEESESTPTVTVTWEKDQERSDIKKKTSGVNGKRKALSTVETSPSKKTKLINDGFCLFVGNLNNSKTFEEVKNSLANYLMTQSILVQDIRLDRSKTHAHVDLASEMDLTKALTLNGEMLLDKPMKIAKAKIKSKDKVNAPAEDKKAKDDRCLFLKNVPYSATKKEILKIFHKAVAVRFPGGTEGPNKGIAFVEFKNKTIAKKILEKKRVAKIQGRVLIVDCVGETKVPKVTKAKDVDNSETKAAALPSDTLFVSNLSCIVKEKDLKKAFQKAVSINIPQSIPQSKGKLRPRGFAFVEFATVADAEKAFESSQNIKICKREVKVQFCKMQAKAKVLSKTLIVMGLAEKTTAETLKSAFEGAVSARVIVNKKTGVSKRFGFVDFEREDNCKAAKEAMEDCEIDGSEVTVAYAKPKGEKGPPGAKGGLAGRPAGKPAGQGAGRGGRGGKGRGAVTLQEAVKDVENKA